MAVTDHPILFSPPMVRAILSGAKSQTRRLAKFIKQNDAGKFSISNAHGGVAGATEDEVRSYGPDFAPWAAGDRLWVREAWRAAYGTDWFREDLGRPARPKEFDPKKTAIEYLADGEHELGGKNRPGIHMPREFSRLTLIVKDVRVERLQGISEADAAAEGTTLTEAIGGHQVWHASHRASFAALWMSINGPDSWSSNPFVAVISFEVHRANIDSLHQEAERETP